MLPRFAIALIAAIVFALPLNAQMRGFVSAGAVHSAARGGSFTLRSFSGRGQRPFGRRPYFFAGPYFYSDYGFDTYSEEPASPEVVMMPPPGMPSAVEKIPAEPLLLELRGDRYVKVGASDSVAVEVQPLATAAQTARPATVLMFRDGHKEEVGGYTIAGSVLYADANYWTQGSWTRKIRIADLDVPATLRLNQERGTNFALPRSPNEVMVRP